jgi:hypothetical protein
METEIYLSRILIAILIYLSPFFSYPYFCNINDPSSEATTSLEWSLSSPPPFHAYSTLPVHSNGRGPPPPR